MYHTEHRPVRALENEKLKGARDKIEQNSNFKFGLIILNNFVASSCGSDLKLSLEYEASKIKPTKTRKIGKRLRRK